MDCDKNRITIGSTAYGSEIGDKELTSGGTAYYADDTQTYEYDRDVCAYAMYVNNLRPMFADKHHRAAGGCKIRYSAALGKHGIIF